MENIVNIASVLYKLNRNALLKLQGDFPDFKKFLEPGTVLATGDSNKEPKHRFLINLTVEVLNTIEPQANELSGKLRKRIKNSGRLKLTNKLIGAVLASSIIGTVLSDSSYKTQLIIIESSLALVASLFDIVSDHLKLTISNADVFSVNTSVTELMADCVILRKDLAYFSSLNEVDATQQSKIDELIRLANDVSAKLLKLINSNNI